jgi:hypothetical protein
MLSVKGNYFSANLLVERTTYLYLLAVLGSSSSCAPLSPTIRVCRVMHSRGERARDPARVRLAADWVRSRQHEISFDHVWKSHMSQGVMVLSWIVGESDSPNCHPAMHRAGFFSWAIGQS